MTAIGFMQGRLSPPVDGRIQAFPSENWRREFDIASANHFTLIEWVVDNATFADNPIMTGEGRTEIAGLCERHDVAVPAITADCFMQAPFFLADGDDCAHRIDVLKALLKAAHALGDVFVMLPLVDGGRIRDTNDEELLRDVLIEIVTASPSEIPVITFESDYPPERLGRFIEALPAAHFGINYDSGDRASGGHRPDDDFAAFGARILNVHVKDRPLGGTTVPLGEGDVDFPSVFRGLAELKYAGNFILQAARAPDGDHLGAMLKYRNMVEHWLGEAGWKLD